MMTSPLEDGGRLLTLASGSFAVERVPSARRGMIVISAVAYRYGAAYRNGRYELTRRVVAGADLWHVRALSPVVTPAEGAP